MRPNPIWRSHIANGAVNDAIEHWHSNQPPREQTVASPSTLTECPRVVWLRKHGVAPTNEMGWGQKQRLLIGRTFENKIAEQLDFDGMLLHHWADNFDGESDKFGMGEGMSRIEGTPDLLLKLSSEVAISDAKTSRADSFAYVPMDERVWEDELWYKYKLQVETYYLLCHKNADWFNARNLPLPTICHLFSFALDDGVVKREFTWKPSQKIASEIIHYANRWNKAYQSEEIPPCYCTPTQTKFCQYAHEIERTKSGAHLGTACCSLELENKVRR